MSKTLFLFLALLCLGTTKGSAQADSTQSNWIGGYFSNDYGLGGQANFVSPYRSTIMVSISSTKLESNYGPDFHFGTVFGLLSKPKKTRLLWGLGATVSSTNDPSPFRHKKLGMRGRIVAGFIWQIKKNVKIDFLAEPRFKDRFTGRKAGGVFSLYLSTRF